MLGIDKTEWAEEMLKINKLQVIAFRICVMCRNSYLGLYICVPLNLKDQATAILLILRNTFFIIYTCTVTKNNSYFLLSDLWNTKVYGESDYDHIKLSFMKVPQLNKFLTFEFKVYDVSTPCTSTRDQGTLPSTQPPSLSFVTHTCWFCGLDKLIYHKFILLICRRTQLLYECPFLFFP